MEQHGWFPTGRLVNQGTGLVLSHDEMMGCMMGASMSTDIMDYGSDHVLLGNMLVKRWHHQMNNHLCLDVKSGDKPHAARHGSLLTESNCNWMDSSQWWVATKCGEYKSYGRDELDTYIDTELSEYSHL